MIKSLFDETGERDMLIKELVGYCNRRYTELKGVCGVGECNHPSGRCSGSCYDCLYQVHFADRHKGVIKKIYDCPKMLLHYVCQYSCLYASELIYAIKEEKEFLSKFKEYRILSVGCGGCVDLMAFEAVTKKRVQYIGIDINENWAEIHGEIKKYCEKNSIHCRLRKRDAFKYFKERQIPDANVMVVSYLISYLFNTGQIAEISSFVDSLVENVVMRKKKGEPFLIIVNDLNSNKKGRQHYHLFEESLKSHGLTVHNAKYMYFDTGDLYSGQKVGTPYKWKGCYFTPSGELSAKYHTRTTPQKTIQLLIEVE